MSKLENLIKQVNKTFKEEIAVKGLKEFKSEKIPFSSPRVNYMTYGGIPRGRLIEFCGEENGGKTTTALDIVGNAQKLFLKEFTEEFEYLANIEKPTKDEQLRKTYLETHKTKKIVYADCENTLDDEWAKTLGVDVDDLIILKPMSQTAEQIFEILLQMIETGEVGLVVIDSLGVMLSAQAYEKTMEEKTYGGIAMALTLFSKKAEMLCTKHDCTLIGINQMRDNLSSPYGGQITTGGRAWKHNCSLRMAFKKGSYLDESGKELKRSAEAPEGNKVDISIMKTKVFKPNRRNGFYTLMYNHGIDSISDAVDTAIYLGLIIQSGAWFTFADIETGELETCSEGEVLNVHGRLNVIEMFKDDEEKYKKLVEDINILSEE